MLQVYMHVWYCLLFPKKISQENALDALLVWRLEAAVIVQAKDFCWSSHKADKEESDCPPEVLWDHEWSRTGQLGFFKGQEDGQAVFPQGVRCVVGRGHRLKERWR